MRTQAAITPTRTLAFGWQTATALAVETAATPVPPTPASE
jgi:hypothetical protein